VGEDFRIAEWRVEPRLNIVTRDGTTTRIEPKVMAVLVCLAQHAGEPVTKDELLQTVWPDTFVTEDVLKRSVFELRRAFADDARKSRVIQTIPKSGYRLMVPVEPVNDDAQSSPAAVRCEAPTASRQWVRSLVVGLAALLIVVSFGWYWLRERLRQMSAFPHIHSIAVLPLENLSRDPTQEYLSDGLTDALITDLAQTGSWRVISRTSSMQYKQTRKSLQEIALELNVDGIIEGTVQRSGDRVRITAQLIHAPEDNHLWASTYERDMQDVFALEREITADIAHEVKAHLTANDHALSTQPRPINPKVLDMYLQANFRLDRFAKGSGDEEKRKASELFQQVIEAEPDFAPAYVGLAFAHLNREQSSGEDLAIAKRAAERAAQLDPASSDAWEILGEINEENLLDWSAAEADYRRAISLNPNNALAHQSLGFFLGQMGRLDEGLKESEIAKQLDPSGDHMSDILFLRREYDRGIAEIQMMLTNHPDDGYLHVTLYKCYTKKGMYKEAVQELVQGLRLFGLGEAATHINRAFARSGYLGAMRQFAKEFERLHDTKRAFFPGNLVEIYAALGEKDRAFYWLDQAYQHPDIVGTDIPLLSLIRSPMADPLRSDPRFKDLLRRIGLPQ
jgi:TolB-like protein/DNA-binding winged helix-turn-helix (wHTH) protein